MVLRIFPSQRLALLLVLLAVLQLSGCAVSPRLKPSDQPSVAGKTFVITGASSGFGRGVALKLAALQGEVVLAARRTDVLEELAAQIRMAGGSALVVTTDVSNPNEILDLARAAIERFGRIDVWINNAAVGALGRFEDVPVEDLSLIHI